MFAFKGFLFGNLTLNGDAVAYYEHFEFFYRNISRGIFPLWEATRDNGVPAEFFLRRIGEFNPFYSLLYILAKTGIPYLRAYFLFEALYFFLGMFGFYKLARHILGEKASSFVAFVLLAFSSSSLLLFHSFTFLIFTPTVWFFYFLFVFTQTPRKKFLLGMVLCLMILMCTYIPFYFLTILISFLLFFVFFYFKSVGAILKTYGRFIRLNVLFVACCLALLAVSTVPTLLFFKESKREEFVLPMRNAFYMKADNVLEVTQQNTAQGGVIATNFYQEPFVNLHDIQPGVFYVPIFAWILLLLGLRTPLNRKLCFMLMWGVGIYFMSVLEAGPIYKFLYQHIFYFKYFRNFQFFLWLVLLPLFILVVCEHLRLYLNEKRSDYSQGVSISRLGFIGLIHGALAVFLWKQPGIVVASSYVAIAMSFVFFVLYDSGGFRKREFWMLLALLGIVSVQALEVYHYLPNNVPSFTEANPYRYEGKTPYLKLPLYGKNVVEETKDDLELKERLQGDLYYSTAAFAFLYERINRDVLRRYLGRGQILVYDKTEEMDYQNVDFEKLAALMLNNTDVALIFPSRFNKQDKKALDARFNVLPSHLTLDDSVNQKQAVVALKDSPELKVVDVDVNRLTLKTNFPSRKFIVYNDNFYTGWQVFINGKAVPLLRANLAFKGVWVPAGESVVDFRFGGPRQQAFKFFMMFIYYGVLIYFLYLLKSESYEPGYSKNK